MKVSELILKLKKMPKDMRVGVSMHDNSEGEVAGWASDVNVEEEVDFVFDQPTGKTVVVIHC